MHRQNAPVLLDAGVVRPRARRASPHQRRDGAAIARFVGVQESGEVLVSLDQNPTPLAARSTIAFAMHDVGCEVVVMFENADPARPIIMGRLQTAPSSPKNKPLELKVDGQTLVLEADVEMVLRCGRSSITLTRAGKVLIRGAYLLSRSSGVNRIKGGSVQIN
jgi:hypothetical protein